MRSRLARSFYVELTARCVCRLAYTVANPNVSQTSLACRILISAFALSTVACGGGDAGTPPPAAGGFSVSLSSASLSLEQGASGTLTASIARTGSFTGSVNLTFDGVPAGVTATLDPATISAGVTSTTLTVSVATSVAPGSYSFTIRGQGTGITNTQTVSVAIAVTARPSLGLTLTPASASIAQGGAAQFIARIARTNVSGFATLASSGTPTGVFINYGQLSDSASFLVTVATNAPVGVYPITISASVSGVSTATATYTLTVTPAPFVLTFAPTSASLIPGDSAQVTVRLARNNFAGPVTLSTGTLFPGISVKFGESPTTADSTTMTVAASLSANFGSGTIIVIATSAGATTQVANLFYDVHAPPVTGSVRLSASPESLTVVAGGAQVSSAITIVRTTFSNPITLEVFGGINGSQAGLSLNPVTGDTTTVTLSVPAGTTPGKYLLSIAARALGINTVILNIPITVVLPASVSRRVALAAGASMPREVQSGVMRRPARLARVAP